MEYRRSGDRGSGAPEAIDSEAVRDAFDPRKAIAATPPTPRLTGGIVEPAHKAPQPAE
jgi:hypothetical protein